MSFTGVCGICESAEGRHTCDQCGSLACGDHYLPDRGVCSQCGAGGRGRESPGP